MTLTAFNRLLMAGLLLVAAGAGWVYPPAGLIVGGALLIVLAFACVRVAGLYAPAETPPEGTD